MNTELNKIEIKENQIAVVTNSEGYPVGCIKSIESIQELIKSDLDADEIKITGVEFFKHSMQYKVSIEYSYDGEVFETEYTATVAPIY